MRGIAAVDDEEVGGVGDVEEVERESLRVPVVQHGQAHLRLVAVVIPSPKITFHN